MKEIILAAVLLTFNQTVLATTLACTDDENGKLQFSISMNGNSSCEVNINTESDHFVIDESCRVYDTHVIVKYTNKFIDRVRREIMDLTSDTKHMVKREDGTYKHYVRVPGADYSLGGTGTCKKQAAGDTF